MTSRPVLLAAALCLAAAAPPVHHHTPSVARARGPALAGMAFAAPSAEPFQWDHRTPLAAARSRPLAPVAAPRLATVKAPPGVAAPTPPTAAPGGLTAALACLVRYEAGGDYHNRRNPTYRGGLQFDRQTWVSVGGHGDPADASPAEQLARAALLHARRGWAPWPVTSRRCGLR